MKRIFDIIFSLILLCIFSIFFILITLLILITSNGSVIYWSKRVGVNNTIFDMPKFRTMEMETPELASDLLENSHIFITPIGRLLRKTSLDELPQLWSIFIGDMSFVGPRPALYNQLPLINLRSTLGIQLYRPGLTGLAQINGRDGLSILQKVELDRQYVLNQSFLLDIKIILLTILKVVRADGVSH